MSDETLRERCEDLAVRFEGMADDLLAMPCPHDAAPLRVAVVTAFHTAAAELRLVLEKPFTGEGLQEMADALPDDFDPDGFMEMHRGEP